MENKKIIYIDWGGLGDHLSLSTLPEAFSKHGYTTYISDKSMFRDDKIFDLVWKSNPYVKGFSNESPNCGHVENFGVNHTVSIDDSLSMHKNIELLYGVDNDSQHPKIFYDLKKIENLDDYILIDLNSFSVKDYNQESIKDFLLNHKEQNFLVILNETYSSLVVSDDFFNSLNVEYIKTEDILHYANLIYSCKKFICLWSGSSVLSSAIKKHYNHNLEIFCFKSLNNTQSPPNWGELNKSYYWYDNINYIKI